MSDSSLSKDLKVVELKRQRLGSSSQPLVTLPIAAQPLASLPLAPQPQTLSFADNIHFPSSLTVTTMKTQPEKYETPFADDKEKFKSSGFGSLINFSLSKDLVVEKQDDRKKDAVEKPKEDMYIPPNNIGSITITPVPSKEKTFLEKTKEPLIRIKSPAVLNEMVKKEKEKEKALENIHRRDKDKHKKDKNHSSHSTSTHKEKKIDTPLHIDTSYQPKHATLSPSPKTKHEISQKLIENMRIAENNIPRPTLVPVHHSPTFIKPDKRPPELKKKKDIVILSDIDPLSDAQQEPVAVDDSSSDVEVVEDIKTEKSDSVPSRDKVSVREVNHKNDSERSKDVKDSEHRSDKLDEATKEDFDSVMKNLRDLEVSITILNDDEVIIIIITVPYSRPVQPFSNATSI